MFLYISRKLELSLKLGPRKLDRVLNSISVFCHFQIHTNIKKNFDRISNSVLTSEIEFETQTILVLQKFFFVGHFGVLFFFIY
jgi:hypothetical protein